ncbi:hypothetical protein JCM16303_002197 [Sporobolomyces ruberrimus]
MSKEIKPGRPLGSAQRQEGQYADALEGVGRLRLDDMERETRSTREEPAVSNSPSSLVISFLQLTPAPNSFLLDCLQSMDTTESSGTEPLETVETPSAAAQPHLPSSDFTQPASFATAIAPTSPGLSSQPLASEESTRSHSSQATILAPLQDANEPHLDNRRRPSLTPSLDQASPRVTPPRTHRINPGAKNYFPLVSSPTQARSPPFPESIVSPSSPLSPDTPSRTTTSPPPSARTSIFPTIQPPSARPAPSNIFPLVKSPSTNSNRQMSANPFPFAEPPLSPTPSTHQPTGRRPSIAPSTTSSKSSSTSGSRIRQASGSSSSNHQLPRSPSSSSHGGGTSIGRTPSITSTTFTTRSPSRNTYASSIAPSSIQPSSEGPTSIFATPVGYKPARSLANLIVTKPSSLVNSTKSKPSSPGGGSSSKFSFFSSSRDKERDKEKKEKGITAPQHLIAGPQRSASNRVLDAALTTSQTWAMRRGEQYLAPSSPAFSPMSPNPAGGGGGATFAYKPGHKVRREQEEAEARNTT